MKQKLKLFVWTNYAMDYTPGLAVALAVDSDQARDLISEEAGFLSSSLAENPDVYDLDSPVAFCVSGGG